MKTYNSLKAAWVLLLALTFFSCGKWSETGTWYRIAETQCSDPWLPLETNGGLTTIEAVEVYLTDLGIQYFSVEQTPVDSFFIACRACICPNGRWIRVLAPQPSEANLVELGFFEE